MSKYTKAIKKLWRLRNKYECLTYQEAEKISITNAEFVDAIDLAIEALEIADRLEYAYHNAFGIDLAKCTKYGNESAEQQRDSYSTVMMYEVAGVFDDILGE